MGKFNKSDPEDKKAQIFYVKFNYLKKYKIL